MRTQQSDKYVVIIGADRGLGRAFALEFASRGYNLILQANGVGDFSSFPALLGSKYGISALSTHSDLKQEENVHGFYQWVVSLDLPLAGLVVFSGGKGNTRFDEIDIEHLEKVLLVNLRAMTLSNRLFLTEFKKFPSTFILNISNSVDLRKKDQLIYAASKAFVFSLTVGLGEEFKNTTTQVSLLLPGLLQSERVNGESLQRIGFWDRIDRMKPEEVAEISVNELLLGQKVIQPGFFHKIRLRFFKALQKWFAKPQIDEKVLLREEVANKEQEKL